MNFYECKGIEMASEMRKKMLASSHHINQKLFATIALAMAENVILSILAGETLALASIRNARKLAEQGDFETIAFIATDSLKREVEDDVLKARAFRFLHRAINFASKEVRNEEYPEFFKFAKDGFAILYESDPSMNWSERIIGPILI